MPELKNSFTQGKMNKDLDERIVPSSEYREALNIGVATSESSDVGAAQNILGNIRITCAIQGHEIVSNANKPKYNEASRHIAATVDPITDQVYRFISTNGNKPASHPSHVWMDRIIEFDTNAKISTPCSGLSDPTSGSSFLVANKEKAVLIDIYKVITNAQSSTEECVGGNTVITVDKNIFQIRHGMLVHTPSGSVSNSDGILDTDDVYIIATNIISASLLEITLNKSLGFNISGDLTVEADRVLNFSPNRYITGINVLDGMIFWTDNYSEPKKISIERSKAGSIVNRINPLLNYSFQNFDQHTKLIVNGLNPKQCSKDADICEDTSGGRITGCTDPLAYNYDPAAVNDDGSCCLVAGCMNPAFAEYDPLACFDDGSCLTPIIVPSPCVGLTTRASYGLAIDDLDFIGGFAYPGFEIALGSTAINSGAATHNSDWGVWTEDLRNYDFEMLYGTNASGGTGGSRYGVKYVAVGKANTEGARVCKSSFVDQSSNPPNYVYTPDYDTGYSIPTTLGGASKAAFSDGTISGTTSGNGTYFAVTFHCWQDVVTWMTSIGSHASWTFTGDYLDPGNGFAVTPALPPFADAINAVSSQSTPVGILGMNFVRNWLQCDKLVFFTDSQVC